MDAKWLATELEKQGELIRAAASDVTEEQAHWKPDSETWSIVEIVNHLYDEEREDFRRHLDDMLHNPEGPWHPIDPFGWITERKYNERGLSSSLQNFLKERRDSVAWLNGLEVANWDASVQAPWDVQMAVGDMAASWLAHDLWHLEQLVRIRRAWILAQGKPYSIKYAGEL